MSMREDLPDPVAGVHIWEAIIAEDALNLGHEVEVIIPAFDINLHWGPARWMPRVYPEDVNVAEGVESEHMVVIPKILMPKKGDKALVLLDNMKRPWVVVWWPY